MGVTSGFCISKSRVPRVMLYTISRKEFNGRIIYSTSKCYIYGVLWRVAATDGLYS